MINNSDNNEEKISIQRLNDSKILEDDKFINFKVIMLGNSDVGKRSFINRGAKSIIKNNFQATIGFEFLLMYYNINNKNKITNIGHLWPRNVSFFNSRIIYKYRFSFINIFS